MQKLRIALLFFFAALSMAWADCPDFTISANGTSLGSGSNVSYSIMIGEDLEFTVDPEDESIVWWRVVGVEDVAVGDKSSFSPPTSIDALGGNIPQSIDYKVRNCNTVKTIKLYLTLRTYTVTFNSDGGSTVSPQTISHGLEASQPTPSPTKTGYTLAYWYLDNENTAFNFTSTPIIDNITLKAKWNINQYTVTFDTDGGSPVNPQTVNHGSTATKPSNPTRAGYTFERWEYPVGTEYNFSNPVTGNITLKAKWNINQYTVTFNSNGGSTVSSVTVDYNNQVAKPIPDPTRTGYTFERWELSGSEYIFSNSVTGNITLTAKWNPKTYTISFNVDCPTASTCSSPLSITATYNAALGTLPEPTLPDYNFLGWFYSGQKYTSGTTYTIDDDITLAAMWQIKTFTVTFNSGEGSTVNPQTVNYGSTAAEPSNPTRTGYTFVQWELPVGTEYIFSNPVTGDITLTAKWNINQYKVIFNFNDGITPNSQEEIEYNSTVSKPSNPTRTEYDFVHWYQEGNENTAFNFNTPITGDITLTAKWDIKKFTVTFNSAGGSAVLLQTVNYDSTAAKPSNPTRAGYDFVHWYLSDESEVFDFNTSIINNITLTAKWDIKYYTITYHYNDGTAIQPVTSGYNIESGFVILPSMKERCGLVFGGWFDNSNFSGENMALFTPNANNLGHKNFYAKWTSGLMTPNANLLDYSIPSNLTYSGQTITPITVNKADNLCPLGDITVLYNGANTLPKDAGTYAISASIAENANYKAAIIPLGNLTINKANITIGIEPVTAENKVYDGTKAANVNFSFSTLLESDQVSANDYSVNANFDSPNVGASIAVNGTLTWLANGPLSKNYNISLSPFSFASSADITQATGILQIDQPAYELTNPTKPIITSKNSFIQANLIIFEYKREDDDAYSTNMPNRVGNWTVRAQFPDDPNGNYTGAEDTKTFTVTRGNATTVAHKIEFTNNGFEKDSDLSGNLRHYYVAETALCEIKNTTIEITVIEPDIILSLKNIDQRKGEPIDGFFKYEIPFDFGKPGLDTLIYTLRSEDDIYSENNIILIETPIPFEAITVQKWNNVLMINNNPQENGGYEFSDFKWFRNGDEVSEMQYYSAGPSSTDVLDHNDIYKATMYTKDGIRISTCEGNPEIKNAQKAAKSTLTKQVLGVNGKSVKSGSKIYNVKGSKTENTPAGVYIIEK